jgi:MFS family permease
MGTPEPSAPLPLARLAGVGLVVFLANAALLVLQLVAGRLLAPFVGSSLETWTAVIGVFLAGIALGNGLGGKLADRYPTPRTLAALLAVGAVAAVWMVLFPMLLNETGGHRVLGLGVRIPVLAALLCLPSGVVLSLLTPVAIKLGLPDVSKTGRVAGLIFALSTLGCLLGNYVTGFYLIPAFTINTLVLVAAASLLVLAVTSLLLPAANPSPSPEKGGEESPEPQSPPSFPGKGDGGLGSGSANPHAFRDIRVAFLIVFLASFGGMTMELTASRVLAEVIGVSLYTWTGVIGVMLAGTALGNFVGGMVADRVNRPGSTADPRVVLAGTLIGAACVSIVTLALRGVLYRAEAFRGYELVEQVLGWTFTLFFLPMFALGMVSPQVIRLAVPDVAHVGRVAGRVYAWSTAGAIAGTFCTGYILLSVFGSRPTMLGVALVLSLTSLLAARVWQKNLLLYLFAITLGGVTGGVILTLRPALDKHAVAVLETNYYTIKITRDYVRATEDDGTEVLIRTGRLNLTLDHLLHSTVDPHDPLFIHYEHEQIQIEFLRAARGRTPNPRVLVIGGGGYTFPRYTMELMPGTQVDVVEIDPGVTAVARQYLGLKEYPGLNIEHMDGRQFVAERAPKGGYDLFIQDAVNDLSVPAHLLTKEYNDAVKADLKPDGVYLLTVIDSPLRGRLWRSAVRTLRQTFPHVVLLAAQKVPPEEPPANATRDEEINWAWRNNNFEKNRAVYVIYASDRPLDMAAMHAELDRQVPAASFAAGWSVGAGFGLAAPTGGLAWLATEAAAGDAAKFGYPHHTYVVPESRVEKYLAADPGVILTDQYAPVDNLMADVFRNRER